jgi:hypothetical protein
MASFCEKFHVSPEYYQHKLSIPQISLMSMDSPRIIYPKVSKEKSGSHKSETLGEAKKVQSVKDFLQIMNRDK